MVSLIEVSAHSPVLAQQGAASARPNASERRMADAVRALAINAVEAARSGDPGLPMSMADAATVLWSRFLKFDAADPRWPDRDRFVLSAGHGAMLLYALLHLTGHAGMEVEALQRFRQPHSPAAGHPEYGAHPAIEASTGPLGQGFAAAVGMALAERLLAARFGKSLVDHRTWVIASDGDLMEGISHEAASLAGHLRLGKLTLLYDDHGASSDGGTLLSCSDDVAKRFAAHGWAVRRVDGHDPAEVAAALSFAVRSKKPSLIACRTIVGFAAPNRAMGWNYRPFAVPDELAARWSAVGARGAAARRGWLKRAAHHPMRGEFERVTAGRFPESWHEALATLKAEIAEGRSKVPTSQSGQKTLDVLAGVVPELIGGSAGPISADLTRVKGSASIAAGNYRGRYVHFGAREHAMAAAMNGMALHGGVIPCAGTFLAVTDYMRPALRLAAEMRQRVIYVLTHDGIGLGEDGASHQPVEHLASLRAMPNVRVLRPADAMETAECWELALRHTNGPSLLVLTSQPVPALRTDAAENRCARGGYVLAEAERPRQASLIATGPEVSVALAAREALAADGIAVAVVSLPCWELFAAQDAAWRAGVLGGAPRIGIEAACGFGWERWLGEDGCFIGIAGFGASAPREEPYRHFGLTPETVVAAVKKRVCHN